MNELQFDEIYYYSPLMLSIVIFNYIFQDNESKIYEVQNLLQCNKKVHLEMKLIM